MQRFMMFFDGSASSMLVAAMVEGMTTQFPSCIFEADKACDETLENSIIPIMATAPAGTPDGAFYVRRLKPGLRQEVTEAFKDMLREVRAARPS